MHIDHSKLIELLTEATGLKEESVQKNLLDLVDEIKSAIQDGDAYEVDGFGVFSGIGDNIIFIPSDDLATEINYKYAGMEPLIMDEVEESEEELPHTETDEPEESVADEEDDPFGGLLDEEDEDESEEKVTSSFELDVPEETGNSEEIEEIDEAEEKPGPDQWGIDTYRDEDDENKFSGLLGKSEEEMEDESALEDDLSSIFGEDDSEVTDDDDDDDLTAALSKQLSDEEEEGDLDGEDEDMLGAFLGDEGEPEDEAEEKQDQVESKEKTFLDTLAEEAKEESEPEDAETVDEDEDNVEDPFEALAASGEEEEETEPVLDEESDDDEISTDDHISDLLNEKEDEGEEVIPVIKNLSSDIPKKKEKKQAKEPEEEHKKKKPFKKKKKKGETQSQPVLLWVILIILLLGGGIYGLGYFNVIHIPGVSSKAQIASAQETTTPEKPQETETETRDAALATDEPETQPSSETAQATQTTQQEQPAQTEVSQNEPVPAGQETYGLRGIPVAEANNGFTIVVFSLSNESNARAKQQELTNNGYRALLARVPSQQYGTLWRVSIGQFASQRNAALAAEDLASPYSENYFITRIR